MSCSVVIRGTKVTMNVENPATICELRRIVLLRLQERRIEVDTIGSTRLLQGQEILIFQEGSTTPLVDREPLTSSEDTTYYTYDKFTRVLVDLYRTVKLSQIHPAVHSDTPTAFSSVVPCSVRVQWGIAEHARHLLCAECPTHE
jgi:hypothetical protein